MIEWIREYAKSSYLAGNTATRIPKNALWHHWTILFQKRLRCVASATVRRLKTYFAQNGRTEFG